MNNIVFIFIISIAFSMTIDAKNSSKFDYDKEWEKVTKQIDELPQSSLKIINEIEKHAIADNLIGQQLLCIESKLHAKESDEDNEVYRLKELKDLHNRCSKETDKLFCKYIISKCLNDYYSRNRWSLKDRTSIDGYIPEDIKEWSANIFKDSIKKTTDEIISQKETLYKGQTSDYQPYIQLKESSRILQPTLFDFICYDMIKSFDFENKEKCDIIDKLIEVHKNDLDKNALAFAKFRKIELTDYNEETKYQELSNLLKEYNQYEASLFIRNEMIKILFEATHWNTKPSFAEIKHNDVPQEIIRIANEGKEKHRKSMFLQMMESVSKQLKKEYLEIELDKTIIHSSDSIKLKITYANIEKLTLKLNRTVKNEEEEWVNVGKEKIITIPLEKTNYLIKKTSMYTLPKLSYGNYVIQEKNEGKYNDKIVFTISDLYPISKRKSLDDDKQSNYFIVLDSKSGKPIENTTIKMQNDERTIEQKTNKDGYAMLEMGGNWRNRIQFIKDEDKYLDSYVYTNSNETRDRDTKDIWIATDRNIYRPDQTIYFKAILYDKENHNTIGQKEISVEFIDSNRQTIEKKEFTTNAMGSISGSFVIPKGLLNGTFRLRFDGGSCIKTAYLKIEEYKRPTFDISIERPQGSYTHGDEITFIGKAQYLTGTPLTEREVRYTIEKSSHWFWHKPINRDIIQGKAIVEKDGTFRIKFKANEYDHSQPYLTYTICATITGSNGETHETKQDISIGERSLLFYNLAGEKINTGRNTDGLFSVGNLYSDGVETNVSYSIIKDDKIVMNGESKSNKDGTFGLSRNIKSLESGKYKIAFTAKDEMLRTCTDTFDIIFFKDTDKRPPVETPLWIENDTTIHTLDLESNLRIRIGSSLKEAYLLCIEENDKQCFNIKWHKLSNETKTFDFKFSEADGNGKKISLLLYYNGELHTKSYYIKKKEESKKIKISLSSFRDRTEPGCEETWTLTAEGKSEKEVLAFMYDKSLDLLYEKNELNSVFLYPKYRLNFSTIKNIFYDNKGTIYGHRHHDPSQTIMYEFDQICDIRHSDKKRKGIEYYACSDFSIRESRSIVGNDMNAESSDIEDTNQRSNPNEPGKKDTKDNIYPIRKDFNETAFFMPELRPDKEGKVIIQFKAPESVTKWIFHAFAHDKSMNHGTIEKEIITQKKLMITPNLPRFFRMEDKCVLTAKIENKSDSDIEGKATLRIADAVTGKEIFNRESRFSTKSNQASATSWDVTIPSKYEALIVTTTCSAKGSSDGEQHIVPVISNRSVVTQAINIAVREGKEKQFTFNQIKDSSTTAETRFLKVEFTANPIWFAIQAMPALCEPQWNDAISLSIAKYANLLCNSIIENNPQIKDVLSQWSKESNDDQTLLSCLEKNKDVKEVLLNETPWISEAQNEKERKQRLALLLDINKRKEILDKIDSGLENLRKPNGSYAWWGCFSGGDFTTTIHVMDFICMMKQIGIEPSDLNEITTTMAYLDREVTRMYKNKDISNELSEDIITYIQLRTVFSNIKMDSGTKSAYNHYYNLLKEEWSTKFTLYGKACAAIIFNRNGEHNLAMRVIDHLRETSYTSEGNGMEWKSNKSGYHIYQHPVFSQAMLIQAFAEVDPRKEELDNMRTWLLNQKRTQDWDSQFTSSTAIHSLLTTGTKWTQTQNKLHVNVGGQPLLAPNDKDAIGHISKTYSPDEFKPNLANIKVKNEGASIAWGATYWQFTENLDKIKKSKSGLYLEKMVMKKETKGGKTALVNISDKNLKIGDKITIRLTLRADRDFEYVCLKDQRASCLEPLQVISGYLYSNGVGYYATTKDVSTYFFFNRLPRGTYVFEYDLWVTHCGTFNNGIATAQCLYAPEFITNTDGIKLEISK